MKSKYFEVRYAKNDEAFAQALANKADKIYEDMISNFGFDDVMGDEKNVLTICENVAQYLETTGKTIEEYQEWMVGNSDFEHRKITILSPHASTTHTAQELEQVFVHETIHMIFDTYAGTTDTPIWCAEGIAILYAGQVDLNYVNESDYPQIQELLDEETFADRGGYDYAGVYVWYFMERYGFKKFVELYNNASDAHALIYRGFEKEAIKKFTSAAAKPLW